MGLNYQDYLREAYRVLRHGGWLKVVEPATRWKEWQSTKPEMYVERLKIPAGMKSQPHWHPDYSRTVAVLSGTFYFGKGEQWDESNLVAYPAGTLYSEPAKSPHFWWAKDGEVTCTFTAIGPTGCVYRELHPH